MQKLCRSVIPSSIGFVTTLLLLSCVGCARPAAEKAVHERLAQVNTTVCDILRDLPTYRGQRVTVTGIYFHGLRQTCSPALPNGLPSVIDFAASSLNGAEEPVTFTTDWTSWDDLQLLVKKEAQAKHKEEIWVTAIGVLRALSPLRDGRVIGGYGHLGITPAQLVVQRVVNVSVKLNPTYDYSELLRPVW